MTSRLFAALLLATAVSACSPVSMMTSTGGLALEDRSTSDQARDTEIRLIASKRLLEEDSALFRAVGTQVWEGRVLLTGAVVRPENKLRVDKIVRGVPGVRDVINEIRVTAEGGLEAFAADTVAEEKLKVRLLADKEIKSVNYSVRVAGGVAYLLGTARNGPELDKVRSHAREVEGVKRVVSYITVQKTR